MEEDNTQFLKDQVQRLSAVLSQYQKKYLPLSPEDEAASAFPPEAPHASWLTNKQFLSPLLVEYDHTISELNQQVASYQAELTTLTARVTEITEENTKLHSDLRKSLEQQLRSSSPERGGAVTEAIQEQVGILSKERDSYIDLWRQASRELEILHKSDREKTESLHKCKTELVKTQQAAMLAQQTIDELQATCENLDQERGQCLSRVQEQERELTSLNDELSHTRAEVKAASIKNTDLKRSLDEITLQLRRRVKESERKKIEDHEHSLDNRIHHLQMHSTDVEAKLLVAQREAALLKGEKSDLEESLTSAQSKLSLLEQREFEAVVHVKESMQIAEDALMEKEQAIVREQQAGQEIGRLKKALATIVQEAGERTRKEVDALREECNLSIDKMAEEIHKLEQECGQRQAQYERAVRDRKAVEKELEKLMRHTPQETTQRGEVLHELQARVCTAERAKEEVVLKLDNALTSIRSLEVQLTEEKHARDQLSQEHTASLRKHQEEVQQYQQQKMTLISEIKDAQQKTRLSEQAREEVEMRLIKERAQLTQKHELVQRELVSRLESTEEAHQRSIHELREVMAAQHRVGARWREESKSLTQKFEQSILNLKAELNRYKQHSEELTIQLQQLSLERKELVNQLQKLTNTNMVLQQQLGETEALVESTNLQVATLLSREKQLLQERRELHRQLDKVKVKMNRIGSMEVPQVLSSSSQFRNTERPRSTAPTPSHPPHYHPPTPFLTTPHTTHLDQSQWNTALSELRHSIQQVRQDLGLRSQQGNSTLQPNDDTLRHSISYSREGEDDQSEHSMLSRDDLAPLQTSSHASLVQS